MLVQLYSTGMLIRVQSQPNRAPGGWRMYVHLEEEIYLNGLLQRRGPLASFPGGASSVGVCTPVS